MKASIIIPAYNAEKSLEAAVLSAVQPAPPFPFEVLVVDDGSTDRTPELIADLSARYPAVRGILQENSGPAAARNRALREAKGEYVLFCDSDDAFLPGAVERAVLLAEQAGAEVLIFGYALIQDGVRSDYAYPQAVSEEKGRWQEHFAPLYRANMLNQVWGKVFAASLLKREGIEFPLMMWGEDRMFVFSAIEKASRVAVSSQVLYSYILQKSSLITRFDPQKAEACRQIYRRTESLAARWELHSPESEEILSYMYVKSLLSVFATLYSDSCPYSYREKRRFARQVLAQEEIDRARRFPSSSGRAFQIAARILKTKNVTANLLVAWGMKKVSVWMPHLFRKAKHAYNKGEK
ncbi:MAG: glycosyltransferase family 2 protein [Clostridia bacterium]|nr:glycosyltransferase family 2 protein [Clostridia bacterium]